jgi:hypothetical protein
MAHVCSLSFLHSAIFPFRKALAKYPLSPRERVGVRGSNEITL